MKIKKFISAVIASAVMAAVPLCANAAEGDATFCFDNSNAVSAWQTYGSIEQTGFTYNVVSDVKESGNGSLEMNVSISKDIPEDERYGGIYLTAESLGLESFKGCTMQASVYFNPEAADATDKFTIYSDGIVWLTSEVSDENTGWTMVSLTVPDTAANTGMGFEIPVFSTYDGTVCYVDNVIIYDGLGNAIANMGDSELSSANVEVSIGTAGRILLIILLAVLVVGIVAGIGFVVSKLLKKFI
ncbi:MAG: hypothetical protein IJ007_07130 [Oscillospiraceae bacterium]|nr:hypothetical protein [Oscillospiraceae bacterium]